MHGASERALERGLGRHRLGAGVDLPVADREVLGPRRHQPPAHDVEHPLAPALGDDRHVGPGRDVVVGLLGLEPDLVTANRSARIVGEDTVT